MSSSELSEPIAQPFLGRYRLVRKLAVGGMAELYLAQVSGVGGFEKQVVVKRILPQLAESEELFRMFLDEARIAATLQHPNVVQIYDACEEDGEYFMAMEYLDGTDLRTLRKVLADRAMPLPWEHALHIVVSVAAGLHYAHDKQGFDGRPLGIVHRDVTPHNVFLTREGGVKLVDFGIAKAQNRLTETVSGTLKGKLAYMSPEQCVGEEVDRRSDIYSLGILLYELTTGRRLYKGTTEYQLIKEIVEGEVKRPSSFMEFPEELEAIIMRCLRKDPEDRFQTARDIQQSLETFAREYQLMISSLAFSAFLEPLLEQATETARERTRRRREVMPIRGTASAAVRKPDTASSRRPASAIAVSGALGGDKPVAERLSPAAMANLSSGVVGLPILPEESGRSVPVEERYGARADEVIDGLLEASKAVPPRAIGSVVTPLPSKISEVPAASTAGDDPALGEAGEAMTARVPDDVLARIRQEELAIIQAEREVSEHDAVPRPVSASGSDPVSTNVVRRALTESDPTIDDMVALRLESVSRPISKRAEIFDPDGLDPRATVHIDESLSMALVAPEQVRLRRGSSSLWLAAAVTLGIGAGIALWTGYGPKRTAVASEQPAPAIPETGTITVGGAADADVWLFVGRAPIDTVAIHSEASHRILVEHEGYHSKEMILGESSWERDGAGRLAAVAHVALQPASEELTLAEPLEPGASKNPRPANLRVTSMPPAASVWLYVGKTPDVRIGNLATADEHQLRLQHGNHAPTFQVVTSEDFAPSGVARVEVELEKTTATDAEPSTPAATDSTSGTGSPNRPPAISDGQPARVGKPAAAPASNKTRLGRPAGGPTQPAKGPARTTKKSRQPEPSWAK